MISLEKFMQKFEYYANEAKSGKIFLYPTDTIYGLGSIVTPKSVNKIYRLKNREKSKAVSLIAPSIEWIKENFKNCNDIEKDISRCIEKYNAITVLLTKNDPNFLTEISSNSKVGVRILKHPFQKFVNHLGEPFITTSANLSGEPYLTDISSINSIILSGIDYVVGGGILESPPSVLIDYDNGIVFNRG